MARRAVRGSRFTRGPRRATDWSASLPEVSGTTVAGSTATLLQSFTPIVGGETLIRTRGLVTIRSDQFAASENMIGAFGMCIVTDQAASIGITAIPHPATDAAWGGWFVHFFYSQQMRFGTGVGFDPNAVVQYPIDSKAMRKVDEDETLAVVVENAGSEGIVITSSVRILSKIH